MTERVVDSKRIAVPTLDDGLVHAEALNVLEKDVMITTISTRNFFPNVTVVASMMNTSTKACKVAAITYQDDTSIARTLLTAKKQAETAQPVMRPERANTISPIKCSPNHVIIKLDAGIAQSRISEVLLKNAHNELANVITHHDVQFKPTTNKKMLVVMTENNNTTTVPSTSSEEAKPIFTNLEIVKVTLRNNNELANSFSALKAVDYPLKSTNVANETSRLLVSATLLHESLLSGNVQTPDEVKVARAQTLKSYRASGLLSALRGASPYQYFQQHGTEQAPKSVEGPGLHRGLLVEILFLLNGKLRSGFGCVGAILFVELVNFSCNASDEVPDAPQRAVIITCKAPIYLGCS